MHPNPSPKSNKTIPKRQLSSQIILSFVLGILVGVEFLQQPPSVSVAPRPDGTRGSGSDGKADTNGAGALDSNHLSSVEVATLSMIRARNNEEDRLREGSNSEKHPVDDTVINPYILKRSGNNWKVWDRQSILYEDLGGKSCNWQPFKPYKALEGRAPGYMCIYPYELDIYVSGAIISEGRWGDCNSLTDELSSPPPTMMTANHQQQQQQKPVYMDIGANIGSCVMQVLFTTEADIYAFEPNPYNLFHLTSSLWNLPDHMKNRVNLFPVALGDETSTTTMVVEEGNMGNTQVFKTQGDPIGARAANKRINIQVAVERVDDLLSPDLVINFLKMDAQGYECFIVEGMKRTLQNMQKVKTEVDPTLGNRFGQDNACTPYRLVHAMEEATAGRNNLVFSLPDGSVPDWSNWSPAGGAADIFGVKRGREEGAGAGVEVKQ